MFSPVPSQPVVVYSGEPKRRSRLRLGWRTWALVVVVAVVAFTSMPPGDVQFRLASQTWTGHDCATVVFECWPVHDWNVSQFGSLEARFGITLKPGARAYTRWECNDKYSVAVAFRNSGGADISLSMSASNAPSLRIVLNDATTSCSFHAWSDGSATGGFTIVGARFISEGHDFTGPLVPSGQPTLGPGQTATPNPFYTYCPGPTATNYEGPAPASLCPLFSPTPPPDEVCDPARGTTWMTLTWSTGSYGNKFSCAIHPLSGYDYRLRIEAWPQGTCSLSNVSSSGQILTTMRRNATGTPDTASDVSGYGNESYVFKAGGVQGCAAHGAYDGPWFVADGTNYYYVRFGCCGNTPSGAATMRYRLEIRDAGDAVIDPGVGLSASPTPAAPTFTDPPNGGDDEGGGFAFPTRFDANICPRPRPTPEIAACAPVTPVPTTSFAAGTARPTAGISGPNDPTAPGGYNAECEITGHAADKVGYVTFAPIQEPGDFMQRISGKPPLNAVLEALGFIWDIVRSLPDRTINAFIWLWDQIVDFVVPSSCLEAAWNGFADQANEHVPLSYVVDGTSWLLDGLTTADADSVDWSWTVQSPLGGGDIDLELQEWWDVVVVAMAPFRDLIGLAAYFYMTIRLVSLAATMIKHRLEPKQLTLGM